MVNSTIPEQFWKIISGDVTCGGEGRIDKGAMYSKKRSHAQIQNGRQVIAISFNFIAFNTDIIDSQIRNG